MGLNLLYCAIIESRLIFCPYQVRNICDNKIQTFSKKMRRSIIQSKLHLCKVRSLDNVKIASRSRLLVLLYGWNDVKSPNLILSNNIFRKKYYDYNNLNWMRRGVLLCLLKFETTRKNFVLHVKPCFCSFWWYFVV